MWDDARELFLFVQKTIQDTLQADLASIHSEEENDFLLENAGNTQKVWAGLRCLEQGRA